jgi:hypothetical protein
MQVKRKNRFYQVFCVQLLKGTVSRDFRPSVFFHQTIPPRALIHGLKPFCIWLRFRQENRDNRLQSSDPVVSMRPRNRTAGSVSAVSMRPRNRILRSHWDCGIGHKHFCQRFHGLIETSGYMTKNFKFYLRIFGCSLPEQHNFSCRIPRSQWDRVNFMTPRESLQKRILVLIPFKGKPS